MRKETLERIVKSVKKNEKMVVVTSIIQSHGGYSASHNEMKVSKEDLSIKEDCLEINMPIEEYREYRSDSTEHHIKIGSITHHLCTKATLYIEYENIIGVAVISGEDNAVIED